MSVRFAYHYAFHLLVIRALQKTSRFWIPSTTMKLFQGNCAHFQPFYSVAHNLSERWKQPLHTTSVDQKAYSDSWISVLAFRTQPLLDGWPFRPIPKSRTSLRIHELTLGIDRRSRMHRNRKTDNKNGYLFSEGESDAAFFDGSKVEFAYLNRINQSSVFISSFIVRRRPNEC